MKFNSLIPELTVRDIERTKRFYTEILSFRVEYERPEDGFAFLSRGDNQLMFEQERGDIWRTGELEYPFGRGVNFEMTVPDVEALHKRLMDAGAALFRPLRESRYRSGDEFIVQKEFLVQDPDGYLLRFTD
ncbi:MAG: VOC family protein [Clostridia bacterium]|nr:VOC family protein [Clostridia bacterium]